MTIRTNQDWAKVEQIARQHELREQDHYLPVKPVPTPTVAQQLAWATVDLAKAKTSLYRKNGAMGEAIMWLECGQITRAKEVIQRAFLDL